MDATIEYKDSGHEIGHYEHGDPEKEHDDYFKVYQPQEVPRVVTLRITQLVTLQL